ncbi:MAG: 4a-hydroxytetrahydrobiopterin dehydratase, partial [Chloroflexota bacterium]
MAVEALTDAAITEALVGLDGWERDGDNLVKTFETATYPQGLAFATAAGMVADGMNHHPDIVIGWKKVTLTFTTHDAGSKISQLDIDTAKAVNAIA